MEVAGFGPLRLMAYTTIDDMIMRYGEAELLRLSDHANTGVMDDDVIEQAINDASAVVDSYLSRKYVTPLSGYETTAVPFYTSEIARYFLYEDAASEEVLRRYRAAIGWLEKVANGEIELPLEPQRVNNGFTIIGRKEIFTDELLEGIGKW